jgi:hypothetical protein
MCTVTFIPTSFSDFVLTSNRDEAPDRSTIPPQKYELNGTMLLFPKDTVAGGTWIGISEKQRLICLLNGGFTSHVREENYRMSRGVIVTDLLQASDFSEAVARFNFSGIEPFTMIVADWENELQLLEVVWDGAQHFVTEKSIAPQIWSSSLLYSEEVKAEREEWFSSFLFENMSPSKEDAITFHTNAGNGNPEMNLIMDRGFVKTKSITQITKDNGTVGMRYEDLKKQLIIELTL